MLNEKVVVLEDKFEEGFDIVGGVVVGVVVVDQGESFNSCFDTFVMGDVGVQGGDVDCNHDWWSGGRGVSDVKIDVEEMCCILDVGWDVDGQVVLGSSRQRMIVCRLEQSQPEI